MKCLIVPFYTETNWSAYFARRLLKHVDTAIFQRLIGYDHNWIDELKEATPMTAPPSSEYIVTDICRMDITQLDGDVYGFAHGGSYEPYDFDYGNAEAEAIELENFPLYKKIFVATQWHKDLILAKYPHLTNVRVTAFPYIDYSIPPTTEWIKSGDVCFTGRLSEDKGYDVVKGVPGIECLRLEEGNTSKDRYIEMLRRYRCSVFPARKETLGISVIECIQNGVIPVMVDGLCYPEIYGRSLPEVYFRGPNYISCIDWAVTRSMKGRASVCRHLYNKLQQFIGSIDNSFL